MPLLRDHQLELIFQTALAQLVRRQDPVDWNLLHTTLCDTTELETQAVQQRGAIDAVTRMMEDAITDHTIRLRDQHTCQQHCTQFETQRREAVDELTATEAELTRRQRRHADLTTYRKGLLDGLVTCDLACPRGWAWEDGIVPGPHPTEFRDDVVRVAGGP